MELINDEPLWIKKGGRKLVLMNSLKELVNKWIKDGSIEEFGVSALQIRSMFGANDKGIVLTGRGIENHERSTFIIEEGISTDAALGQLVTLQSVNDSVIWITESFTDEHMKAVKWLESSCHVRIRTGCYDIIFEEPPKLIKH